MRKSYMQKQKCNKMQSQNTIKNQGTVNIRCKKDRTHLIGFHERPIEAG